MLVFGQHRPPQPPSAYRPARPRLLPDSKELGLLFLSLLVADFHLFWTFLLTIPPHRVLFDFLTPSVSLTPWLLQNFISPPRTDGWGRGTIRLYVLDLNNSLYFIYHLCLKPWFFFFFFKMLLLWMVFKIFYWIVTILLLLSVLVFRPRGMWGLSSSTKDDPLCWKAKS